MRKTTAEPNEATACLHKDTTEDQGSETVTNISSLNHEKILKGTKNKDFEKVIKRLSKRYGISDDLKNRILEVKENESSRGELRLEGENYCVVVVKHEDKLDIYLSRVVTQYS